MAHSLVPHQHGIEVGTTQANNYASEEEAWFDLLQDLFHADLGAEHLEHFDQSDQQDLLPNPFLAASYLVPAKPLFDSPWMAEQQEAIAVFTYTSLPPPSVYHSAFSLRGPPSIS